MGQEVAEKVDLDVEVLTWYTNLKLYLYASQRLWDHGMKHRKLDDTAMLWNFTTVPRLEAFQAHI